MASEQELIDEARAIKASGDWIAKIAELKTADVRTSEGREKILTIRTSLRPSVRRLADIAKELGRPIPDVE